jgi:DnaK suppressor protein
LALSGVDTQKFKDKLLARREELGQLSAISSESRQPVALDQQSVGRLSRMDAMQGQAMALATEERREQERVRVDAALFRIEGGDYGFCVKCEENIDIRRLELDASTPLCLDCAQGKS